MASCIKRLQRERELLPDWCELFKESQCNGFTTWSVRLQTGSTSLTVRLQFCCNYPFKAPSIALVGSDDEDLDCQVQSTLDLRKRWTPTMRVESILKEVLGIRQIFITISTEVADLAAALPPWLLWIEKPRVPRYINVTDAGGSSSIAQTSGLLRPVAGGSFGPWTVTAAVRHPHRDPEAEAVRVQLTISRQYPLELPRVVVLNRMQHILGASIMPEWFYDLMTSRSMDASSIVAQYSIKATLQMFHDYLHVPLPQMLQHGLNGLSPEHAQKNWEAALHSDKLASRQPLLYRPHRLHPFLFDVLALSGLEHWQEYLMPNVFDALQKNTVDDFCEHGIRCVSDGVFEVPLFTDLFTNSLLAEIDNYKAVAQGEGWMIRQPNTMNRYGVIIDETGLEPMINALIQNVLVPLCHVLYPGIGSDVHDHHTFTVEYENSGDKRLDMHTDNSDITANICLGKSFEGGGLVFCGHFGQPKHRKLLVEYSHTKGSCLLHRGDHRHGAEDILSGTRCNLICWLRNHSYRRTEEYRHRRLPGRYEQEDGPPDLVCTSWTHDKDFTEYRPLPEGVNSQFLDPWCPPDFARHQVRKADQQIEDVDE